MELVYGTEDNPLVITLVSDQEIDTEALSEIAADTSDLVVEFDVVDSFEDQVNVLCENDAQVIMMDGVNYLAAINNECADVGYVAVIDGQSTFSLDLVPTDSIDNFADLDNATFCRVPEMQYRLWDVLAAYLADRGTDIDTLNLVEIDDMNDIEEALMNEECDAGFIFGESSDLAVLDTISDIPNPVLAIDNELPEDTLSELETVIMALDPSFGELFGWDNLTLVEEDTFENFQMQLDALDISFDVEAE